MEFIHKSTRVRTGHLMNNLEQFLLEILSQVIQAMQDFESMSSHKDITKMCTCSCCCKGDVTAQKLARAVALIPSS